MKQLIAVIVSALLGVCVASASVSAGTLAPECDDPALANSSICTELKENQDTSSNRFYGPNGLLTRVAGLIAFIGGIAAVVMIVLGGFTFITGSGDPNKLSAARNTVMYAVIGLIIIVIPGVIIRFVLSKL